MPRARTGSLAAKPTRSDDVPRVAGPNARYWYHPYDNAPTKSIAKPATPAGKADSSKVKEPKEKKEPKVKVETEPKEKKERPKAAMPPEAAMPPTPAGEDDDELLMAGSYRRDEWHKYASITDTAAVLED